jgi:hypothetical protein
MKHANDEHGPYCEQCGECLKCYHDECLFSEDGQHSVDSYYLDTPPETEAEIDAYLRAHGYDPEQLAKQARDIFGGIIENSPLNPKNQA